MAQARHAALVLLLAFAASTLAQQISVSGSGCGVFAPNSPANLKATPGDSQVTLTFDKPPNGACVDAYNIKVEPVGPTPRGLAAPQPIQTQQLTVTVSNLQNGQEYRFTVTAVNKQGQADATTTATPQASGPKPCDPKLTPGPVTNLNATGKSGGVTLCFEPPANNGCVDEYQVSISQKIQAKGLASQPPKEERYNKGGCFDVQGLSDGTQYTANVKTYSKTSNGGADNSVDFTAGAASTTSQPVGPQG